MDMLMFELRRGASTPLYEQLYEGIKQAILDGQIAVEAKLPSKRKLADFLSISQTTVELAYGQLVAEGYIEARERQGFFVQEVEELILPDIQKTPSVSRQQPEYAIDFNPGAVDASSFPFATWRKLTRDVFDESNSSLLQTGHPQGDAELRSEIAHYLYQSRGVICEADQIVIGSGTEQLMPLLIRLLDKSLVYAFENPGYPLTHTIFNHYDRHAVPVAVDAEGLAVRDLEAVRANVAYVTPSHQFPTGAVMSAARRTQLLNWAAAKPGRYVIEDDYDSEFRYTGKPIPSLQSMDKSNRVIYISTFSKSIMPSLRIAYMVLPDNLLEAYQKTFHHYASTVPRTDQQLLALFMKEGYFLKHLNRMRSNYRKKWDLLVSSLRPFAPAVQISGSQAGMHIVLTVHTALTENELVAQAKQAGIRVFGLNAYYVSPKPANNQQLLLGFGGLSETAIRQGVLTLMECWNITKTGSPS